MPDYAAFQQKQFAFAAHIRDPANRPPPEGIEERRLAIYRELFFNNLLNLLGSTFPVLRKLHKPDIWRELVRDFMIRHRARTPYFLELPGEFVTFLQQSRSDGGDFPFLSELAHYEWMELALSVSDDHDDMSRIDASGDMVNGTPVKSTLAWPLSYRFPVHRIAPDYIPTEPEAQPTFLVIFRKPDDEIEFREINPVTARLLELVSAEDGDRTGRDLLLQLAEETAFDPTAMLRHGADILNQLRADGILPGTKKEPEDHAHE